jgi:hypothetical protein
MPTRQQRGRQRKVSLALLSVFFRRPHRPPLTLKHLLQGCFEFETLSLFHPIHMYPSLHNLFSVSFALK